MTTVEFSVQSMPGETWSVVLKRSGAPDEFLVDDAGSIRHFATPTEALAAGQRATGAAVGRELVEEARAWRQARNRR